MLMPAWLQTASKTTGLQCLIPLRTTHALCSCDVSALGQTPKLATPHCYTPTATACKSTLPLSPLLLGVWASASASCSAIAPLSRSSWEIPLQCLFLLGDETRWELRGALLLLFCCLCTPPDKHSSITGTLPQMADQRRSANARELPMMLHCILVMHATYVGRYTDAQGILQKQDSPCKYPAHHG